jgi:hypothetical protein
VTSKVVVYTIEIVLLSWSLYFATHGHPLLGAFGAYTVGHCFRVAHP